MMTRRWASRPRQILSTAWLILTVASPLLAAPSQPAAGRDTVVIGILQEREPPILHPLFSGQATTMTFLPTVFIPDVQRDDRWKLFPVGLNICQPSKMAPGKSTARS